MFGKETKIFQKYIMVGEKIDIVYPLGEGSTWNDNELRYSIRSLVEFVNINRIIVVGKKPLWASDEITHIDMDDPFQRKKNLNIILKTLRGAEEVHTPRFLRLSDDHVINRTPDFSPYHRGRLPDTATVSQGDFIRSCHETYKFLKGKGLPTYDYEGHYPVIVDTKKFISAFTGMDMVSVIGYAINSTYFNQTGVFPPEPAYHVLRLRDRGFDGEAWKYTFLNYSEFSLSDQLKAYLQKRFPNKTIYER